MRVTLLPPSSDGLCLAHRATSSWSTPAQQLSAEHEHRHGPNSVAGDGLPDPFAAGLLVATGDSLCCGLGAAARGDAPGGDGDGVRAVSCPVALSTGSGDSDADTVASARGGDADVEGLGATPCRTTKLMSNANTQLFNDDWCTWVWQLQAHSVHARGWSCTVMQ